MPHDAQTESEWQTRKRRIDGRLAELSWTVAPFRPGVPLTNYTHRQGGREAGGGSLRRFAAVDRRMAERGNDIGRNCRSAEHWRAHNPPWQTVERCAS
jgi:hypothetical protein